MTSWGFLQSAVVATGAADYRHCCNTFVIVDDRFHRAAEAAGVLMRCRYCL